MGVKKITHPNGTNTPDEIVVEYAIKDNAGNIIKDTYAKSSDLSEVATSGSYADLSNKPTIPTNTSDLTNDSGYITSSDLPITDVQVDGTTIINNKIANLTSSKLTDSISLRGAYSRFYGIGRSYSQIYLASAMKSEIDNRTEDLTDNVNTMRKGITERNIDYAVKQSLVDPKTTAYSDAEKISATTTIGAENIQNKTNVLSSSSTNSQYPSAKCVYDNIENVREVAEGKTKTYVVDYTIQTEFNSQNDAIHLIGTSFVDANGNSYPVSSLKLGDTIYVEQTDVPDRWVGAVELNQTVSILSNTQWRFNDILSSIVGNWTAINLNFIANGNSYSAITGYTSSGKIHLKFDNTEVYNAESSGWIDEAYQSISIVSGTDVETANVISWFNSNAVLQGDAYNATLYILETAKVPIESISVNGTNVQPVLENVDITVPTKTSDLTNDSDFVTADEAHTYPVGNTNYRIQFKVVNGQPQLEYEEVV